MESQTRNNQDQGNYQDQGGDTIVTLGNVIQSNTNSIPYIGKQNSTGENTVILNID